MIPESSGTTFSEECSKENRDPEVVDQSLYHSSKHSFQFVLCMDSCKIAFNFYTK